MAKTDVTRNFSEMNLSIFRGDDPGGVFWQPRLEFWYQGNKDRGTLPDNLRDAEFPEIYDYCHASVRYFGKGLRRRYKDVKVTRKWEDKRNLRLVWETPVGTLTNLVRYDELGVTSYNAEYKLKGPQDFKVLEFIIQDEEWCWEQEAYERDLKKIGERGAPQFFFSRSPIQGLFVEHMGFENTIYMMYDHPEVINRYVEVKTQVDDALYEVLCQCPVQILNFGENMET